MLVVNSTALAVVFLPLLAVFDSAFALPEKRAPPCGNCALRATMKISATKGHSNLVFMKIIDLL
jgi:hypothetical protein